jgi:hypothetical protein
MTQAYCYPWWHSDFQPLVKATAGKTIIRSGCSLNAKGNIGCEPEAMRLNAEAQLRVAGYLSNLSLETYTLARYMQGEVGSGTIEERVAVGEAAVNRAKLENKRSVLDILLYRQAVGHPNRGYYGPIHGTSGVTTAPYGRWATTNADPSILTTLLADLVTSGKSGNFSRGADDQDGIEYASAFPNIPSYVKNLANRGKFWVGPLPGIDHWHTFLQTTYRGETATTPTGAMLVAETLKALDGRIRPVWPPDLPVCGKPINWLLIAGITGTLVGAWASVKGLFRRVGS